MKFRVVNESWLDPPCKNCIGENYIRIDERTVDDPSKNICLKDWYKEGTNHRLESGHIKRDFIDTGYFVEISNLEMLREFIEDNGSIIVEKDYENQSQMRIVIDR